MPKPYTCAWLLLLLPACLFAQDFSNKGRDFWVGYGNHVKMASFNQANAQEMVLYITSTQDAHFKVEIPGTGWTYSGTVMANAVISTPPIPKSGVHDARLVDEGLYKRGIHITSDRAVVAYAHIYNQNVSGATLLFPTTVLGIDYYSINFTQRSNEAGSYSYFYAVAAEDDTQVEIIPSKKTRGGRPAGVPFVVTLMRGEVYNVLSDDDLTGSTIRSVSGGAGGCKKIAVFSGSGKLTIACGANQNSADNLMQQAFPAAAWGKQYLTAPTAGMPNNFYRIAVSDPATIVRRNGLVLTGLQENFYYEYQSATPDIIEASQPVMVAQYMTTQQECGNTGIGQNGDPEMIYLSPIEQTIDRITLNSTTNYQISSHYINVIIKTAAAGSFRLDGVAQTSQFTPHPVDGAYSVAILPVRGGPHQLTADRGFNAIAYGYGNLESYGYNAGANVIDQYQYLTVTNGNGSTHSPAACNELPFTLALTLPYQPTRLVWDIPLHPGVTDNAPAYSATFTRNGRQLYVYQLPGSYVYHTPGVYALKVTIDNPTGQGCSGQQLIEYDFEVFDKPVVSFTADNPCSGATALFTDITDLADRYALKRYWDLGDGEVDSVQQVAHVYTTPGSYTVRLALTTDVGCVSDTFARTITVKEGPLARFGTAGSFCVQQQVVISDSSVKYNTIPLREWKWDFGDGSPAMTHTMAPAPFTHTYTHAGSYSIRLTVKSATDCYSTVFEQVVTIDSFPVAAFTVPAAVCLLDPAITFMNESKAAAGSPPLSYQWHFGDPQAAVADNTATTLHGQHPYSQAGIYNVRLIARSPAGCADTLTRPVTINGGVPQASFVFDKKDAVCAGEKVRIINRSTVDFGQVSRLEICWDAVNKPTEVVTEVFPAIDNVYEYVYPVLAGGRSEVRQIRLRAWSGDQCMHEVRKSVTIHPLPVLQFAAVPDQCANGLPVAISLPLVANGLAGTGSWSGPGMGSDNRFTPSLAGPGSHTLQYRYTSVEGCKAEATQAVKVYEAPDVSFSITGSYCQQAPMLFVSVTGAKEQSIAQWLWDFGDRPEKVIGHSPIINHAFDKEGVYTVGLEVITDRGCKRSAAAERVEVAPVPDVDFRVPVICLPVGNASFTNLTSLPGQPAAALQYQWDFGDPNAGPANNSTDQHPEHRYAGAGPFTVSLTATSAKGCKASDIRQVQDMVQSPVAAVEWPLQTCVGDRLLFKDKSSPGAPAIVAWNWQVGQQNFTTRDLTYTFSRAGAQTVSLIVANDRGCRSEPVSRSVTLYNYPFVQAGPDVTIVEGESDRLAAKASGTNLQWQWSPAIYLDSAQVLQPVVKPTADIVYRLTATGEGGCAASDEVKVLVLKKPVVPNAFSPNGDGIHDLWRIEHLYRYPGNTVEVFNRNGQLVFRSTGYQQPWDGTRNGQPVPVGTYYYVIDPRQGLKKLTGSVTILR